MAAEPVFSETTEDLWDDLPEVLRAEDEANPTPYVMKRWIASMADQVGDVQVLAERFDFAPADEREADDTYDRTHSDLVDPVTADDAWIPWLAQLVGAPTRLVNVQQQRAAIAGSSSGFRSGTKGALAVAAATALTGAKSVTVVDHSTSQNPGGVGTGTQWDVLIVTRGSETPSAPAVLKAVVDLGAKPAGVVLYHRTIEASWDTLEAQRPTWNDWDGKTWQQIEETGL